MNDIESLVATALQTTFPPLIDDPELEGRVRAAVAASGRKIVVLDDDPTGVQTVHDTMVLAGWDVPALAAELANDRPLFFVLTNSRSVPEAEAAGLNREIAKNLLAASEQTGARFAVVSRSDSTLRGHFPAETDALVEALGGIDGVLICPAFFEGGRITAGDVHFVREKDRIVPAAETEFARDATFGYRARTLPAWVEEKSRGRTKAGDVASISLEEIRLGGPDRIATLLRGVRGGQPVIINALGYTDLWTVVLGLIQAEDEGKRFLYRSGASFVRARAGISARPLLTRDELLRPDAPSGARGVVIVGSHVRRTTEQLEHVLSEPGIVGIEVDVGALLTGAVARDQEIATVSAQMNGALRGGATPVVFTARAIVRSEQMNELAVARAVSDALVAIMANLEERPDFVIGKGGITSSDIGVHGLQAERALVLGQIRAGVPVWRLGAKSRFPGLPYVVFPGNVGEPETLAAIVRELQS